MPKSNPRALTKGVGATHGVTCPNCNQAVPNVTSGAVFGAYVPISAEYMKQLGSCYNQWDRRVKGTELPDPPPLSNWMFYGTKGKRWIICEGDGFKHYRAMGTSFLWFAETSRDEEQERMKL